MNLLQSLGALALSAGLLSCQNQPPAGTKAADSTAAARIDTVSGVKVEPVRIRVGQATLRNYVAYNAKDEGRHPIVLVIPEWWGLTDYEQGRARQLAQLGYFAMAVDVYGDGRLAKDPKEAGNMAGPFYNNPQAAKERIDASLAKARTFPQTDTSQTAIIGYCFGGTMALDAAFLGSDFDGLVTFHGGLEVVPPQKDKLKAKILIAQGGADSFVPQERLQAVRHSLDSVGANYTVKVYPDATHAFTNPKATENGKKFNLPIRYNPAADSASWNDMKAFFGQLFK